VLVTVRLPLDEALPDEATVHDDVDLEHEEVIFRKVSGSAPPSSEGREGG